MVCNNISRNNITSLLLQGSAPNDWNHRNTLRFSNRGVSVSRNFLATHQYDHHDDDEVENQDRGGDIIIESQRLVAIISDVLELINDNKRDE